MDNKKRYRLPRSVNLGRGYLVKIRVMPMAELKHAAGIEDEEGAVDGAWEHETLTIYIDRGLSIKRRWEIYWHELLHAVNDILAEESDNLRP